MKYRNWLLFALFPLLAACEAPPAPVMTSSPAAVADDAGARAVASVIARPAADVRGYFEARDGGLFTQCGETSRRRVASIAEQTQTVLKDAPGARFVAARGVLRGSDEVEIGEIEVTGGDAWNCESRFDQFFYAARGTDAPWTLEVTGAAVTFTDAPGSPPLLLPYRAFEKSGDQWRFEVDNGTGDAFRIALVGQACVDRMTDSVHALTATIVAGDRTYRGCAWRGELEP